MRRVLAGTGSRLRLLALLYDGIQLPKLREPQVPHLSLSADGNASLTGLRGYAWYPVNPQSPGPWPVFAAHGKGPARHSWVESASGLESEDTYKPFHVSQTTYSPKIIPSRLRDCFQHQVRSWYCSKDYLFMLCIIPKKKKLGAGSQRYINFNRRGEKKKTDNKTETEIKTRVEQ